MNREPGHTHRLAIQIQLLQRLMVRASAAGDHAELNRLADLMESHTVTTIHLAPWFARELVRGWMTHLPTGPRRPVTAAMNSGRSRGNDRG
jgi:hypothetical protein